MPTKLERERGKIGKTTHLPPEIVRAVERAYAVPGQNFKWDPHLRHLVERDLKARKACK